MLHVKGFSTTLKWKPIVILSNNDGCVIARSNEAKALGIPMGAPAFKFKQIFKKIKLKYSHQILHFMGI